MTDRPKQSAFWAHVTIFGTLWGGLELTLGTFLHVLHVPKTGLIMTALSATLLIAMRQIYPRRGSTLAAAAVASCIKCLSPGGIILGPVIGILSEAAMLELGLLPSSRSRMTAAVAATLAVISCQAQSFFKLWVYYGNDFLRALIRMCEKFFDTAWTSAIGWMLISALLLVFVGVGCAAGFLGLSWGRQVTRELQEKRRAGDMAAWFATSEQAMPPQDAADAPKTERRPFILRSKRCPEDAAKIAATRWFVLPFAVATLVIQFSGKLAPMAVSFAVWAAALAVWARPVLRALWWPKFWALTVIISLCAGSVLAWEFGKSFDFAVAAEASAKMILRGGYVFALIAWATRCVRSREVMNACQKLHVPQLAESLTASYEILPEWLDRFNDALRTRPRGLRNQFCYLRDSAIEILLEAAMGIDTRDSADDDGHH